MTTELTKRKAQLPALMKSELLTIRNSPGPYYVELRPERINDVRPAHVPTLGQICRENGFANALAAVSWAIYELSEWFNVKNNITTEQVSMTAELILDHPLFADLTLANIKACFRQKMMDAKLYDRLDGSIIIGWLREFASAMAEHCLTVSIGRERERRRKAEEGPAAELPMAAQVMLLELRARGGDRVAQSVLADMRQPDSDPEKVLNEFLQRNRETPQERDKRKEEEFRKFRAEYVRKKLQEKK